MPPRATCPHKTTRTDRHFERAGIPGSFTAKRWDGKTVEEKPEIKKSFVARADRWTTSRQGRSLTVDRSSRWMTFVQPTCQIDQSSFPVHRPVTPEEVGDRVRAAVAAGHAVFPLGGRTQLGLGLPPDRAGVGLDLTSLSQVIDYPARDMTITVQAGITISELQRLLTDEGQRLPIDIPFPDRATLGGSIAVNASGSRRLAAGTLR